MADVDVYQAFKELIERIMGGDQEVAELAATDPEGVLEAYGVTGEDLADVDLRQAVAETYGEYELAGSGNDAIQSYLVGDPPPEHYQVQEPPAYTGGPQTTEQAAQHLQYVTYASHEQNEYVTQEIVNHQSLIDNSDNRVFDVDNSTAVDVDLAGELDGDLLVAPTNQTAGDGAVQGGEEVSGAVNTGRNDGILADGEVRESVAGEDNQAANLDIEAGGGAGGDASGAGGIGGDARAGAFGSGTGGDANGTGGDADGGDGGEVGPISIDFGAGEARATEVGDDAQLQERPEAQLGQEAPPAEAEEAGQEARPIEEAAELDEQEAGQVEILPVGEAEVLPAEPAPVGGAAEAEEQLTEAVPGA